MKLKNRHVLHRFCLPSGRTPDSSGLDFLQLLLQLGAWLQCSFVIALEDATACSLISAVQGVPWVQTTGC